MSGIQWGNPKITVEEIPDPNTVNSTDEYRQMNESMVLEVKDIFPITGRGTVVTGIVENGVKVCEEVRIINPDNTIVYSKIIGIELDRKLFDGARRGDDVGLLLGGVKKVDVQRGAIIEKKPYSKEVDYFANNENVMESQVNNNVFVIEKKAVLRENIVALVGRIEGNLTIRPNMKMQIHTFIGETLDVDILGVKWDGRICQEINNGSNITLAVSGISVDSVDTGDELMAIDNIMTNRK